MKWLLVALLALSILAATQAEAKKPYLGDMVWQSNDYTLSAGKVDVPLQLYYSPTNLSKEGLSEREFKKCAEECVAAWNRMSPVKLFEDEVLRDDTGAVPGTQDGISLIGISFLGAGYAGLANRYTDGNGTTVEGDVRIGMNATQLPYTMHCRVCAGQSQPLTRILAHEIGHLILLGHVTGATNNGQLMSTSVANSRDTYVGAGDRLGVLANYAAGNYI